MPLAGSPKPEKSGGWVEVLRLDLDVRLDGLGARLETGLELLDQGNLDAADEADVALGRLQRRRGADQERALLLGEDQVRDVGALGGVVVDDGELGVGELGRDLGDRRGVGEADRDDRVEAARGEQPQALLLGRLGLAVAGLQLVDLDAELGLGLVEARGGGVVEGLVATAADVVREADLGAGGGGGRGRGAGRRGAGSALSGVATATGGGGKQHRTGGGTGDDLAKTIAEQGGTPFRDVHFRRTREGTHGNLHGR